MFTYMQKALTVFPCRIIAGQKCEWVEHYVSASLRPVEGHLLPSSVPPVDLLPADGNFCDWKAGGVMNLFILQDRFSSRFNE